MGCGEEPAQTTNDKKPRRDAEMRVWVRGICKDNYRQIRKQAKTKRCEVAE